MEINLNDIPNGIAESNHELKMLKSAKIFKELNKLKSDFNIMTVSVNIFNIIESHDLFQRKSSMIRQSEDGIFYAGSFCYMDVYVDLFLHPYQLVLSYDRQIIRNNKLDSILNNSNNRVSELVISVLD